MHIQVMPQAAENEKLFERFKAQGDVRALAKLFDRTAPELLRVATYLSGDPHLAEDLVQSTYLTALQSAQDHQLGSPVLPWLLGILGNRARDLHRRRARSIDARRTEQGAPEDPAREAEAKELREVLERQVDALNAPYREVLSLHLQHGLSAAQIAEALDRPPGTVRTQIMRGMEKLRTALPAGLAVSATLLNPPVFSALAAVRSAVLEAAGRTPSGMTTGTALASGGWLAMKLTKTTILAWVAALALLTTLAAVHRFDDLSQEQISAPVDRGDSKVSAAQALLETAGRPKIEGTRRAGEPSAAMPAATGLIIHSVYAGVSVSGVKLRVHPVREESILYERRATADEQGRTLLENLEPGPWRVYAATGGEVEVEVVAKLLRAVTLELSAGREISGIALDQSGRPVPGATIWISTVKYGLDEGQIVAHSDEVGRFHLEHVEVGRFFSASAQDHYRAPIAAVIPGTGEQEIELLLATRGGSLSGLVLGEDARPLANAVVQVGATQSGLGFLRGSVEPPARTVRVRTDEEGLFVVHGIPKRPGAMSLWVRAAGYAVSTRQVRISGTENSQVVVQLERGSTVFGSVRGPDGEARGQVAIEASQAGVEPPRNVAFTGPPWARRRTTSAADGSFRLENLQAGDVRMIATAEGLRFGEGLRLLEGEERSWHVELAAPTTIVGMVVDEAGIPLVGWDVWARGSDDVRDPKSAKTDESGAFLLAGCEEGEYEVFTRTSIMYRGAAHMDGVRPRDGPITLTVAASQIPSAFLSGRAVGPDGNVLEQVRIGLSLVVDGHNPNGAGEMQAGEFSIGPVVPGFYQVTVAERSISSALDLGSLDLGLIELRAHDTRDLGTLRFEPRASVSLEVRDPEGEPLRAGRFTLTGIGHHWATFIDVRNGRGTSEGVQPGEYLLQPWASEHAYTCMPLTLGAGEERAVRVELQRGVARTLRSPRVSRENTLIEISWRDEEGRLHHHSSTMSRNLDRDHDQVVHVMPGKYVVSVGLRGLAPVEMRVEVDAVDREEMVIVLPTPAGW